MTDKLLPDAEIQRLEERFPARTIAVGGGAQVSVRECGQGPVLVCLHGIGSGAASWLDVAQQLAGRARVIAWDAPGYGDSTSVVPSAPWAVAYADRLRMLLDALQIERCVLVGHSLGALMAGAAARRGSTLAPRIARLVLMSPARGYGAPGREAEAARVHAERLDSLKRLGIAGMAAQRSGRLVSDGAGELSRAWVRWNMARLNEAGYRQAVELLCGDDLFHYLPPVMPVRVLCGEHDVVTPPAACAEVAAACGTKLEFIEHAGHACYVEQPGRVAEVLAAELEAAWKGRA
ncbi:MAG: alpha/beta hydrolase [Acidovorax sp.]|uniref:alpha/beta fold hydrolase n=1 Tax=Acidovorax sp. TaxID=1872122 RepID=UPI0039E4154F